MSDSAAAGRDGAVVLVTCEYDPFPGGMATFAANLVAATRANGDRVEVIAPAYPDLPQSDEPDVYRLWRHHRIGARGALQAISLIGRHARTTILVAFDIRSVLLMYLCSRITRRRYRVVIHGSEVAKFAGRSRLKPLVKAAYLKAEAVLANSAATLDIFERSFGKPRRGVVAYLGVDRKWFAPAPDEFENAELAALPDHHLLVSSVGRIEDRKGQLETVEMLARAQRTIGNDRLTYIVVGRAEDPAYADRVRAVAAEKGVRLLMPGRLSDADIIRLHARSLCHVLCARPLASKIEGFGLVLLEAAAQGCPSIATRVGGIPEVVGADWPLLYDADDLAGMADGVAELARNRAWRGMIGEKARVRARQFTWENCARVCFPELFDAHIAPATVVPA